MIVPAVSSATTKTVAGLLLLIFGGSILFFAIVVTAATTLTRLNWWIKRRRNYQRSMDVFGKVENTPLKDRLFYYTDLTMEALSLKLAKNEQTAPNQVNKVRIRANSFCRVGIENADLPLRFQPEKLYGATSTVHRQNIQRKSTAFLDVQPAKSVNRRASMVDHLLFLVRSSGKPTETAQKFKHSPRESLSQPHWITAGLPQIDVTCVQDELTVGDSCVNLPTSGAVCMSPVISLPARRASSTNFELSTCRTDDKSYITGFNSCEETEIAPLSAGSTESTKESITKTPKSPTYLLSKRSSLSETADLRPSMFPLKHSTLRPKPRTNEVPSDYDSSKVTLLTSQIHEEATEKAHIPSTMAISGGAALMVINREKSDSPFSSKLIIQPKIIKGMQLQKPWQKTTCTLEFFFHGKANTQQNSLTCRECEFGVVHFSEDAPVGYYLCDTPWPEGNTAELCVHVYEYQHKWSGGKAHYYGSVKVNLTEIFLGKALRWYQLEPAYPIIRIKADFLISLCHRPVEGVISLGVHEIRNAELVTLGPWKLERLKEESIKNHLDLDVHACLTYKGRMVKSKKSVIVQRPCHKSWASAMLSKSSAESNPQDDGAHASRLLSGDHVVQLSIPSKRRSSGTSPLSSYGILIFVARKINVANRLTSECIDQLKLIGLAEEKSLYAIGECFVGDEVSQVEYKRETGQMPMIDSQCNALWNEAANHASSKIYQWLSVK
ncbi:unnamed protein product [Dicrocoelium dendriticum]|nr:unnamed protein product [Dicrocoelium dendriticum]